MTEEELLSFAKKYLGEESLSGSALIFLLNVWQVTKDAEIGEKIEASLDGIEDAELRLWALSLAYRLFGKEEYKSVVEKEFESTSGIGRIMAGRYCGAEAGEVASDGSLLLDSYIFEESGKGKDALGGGGEDLARLRAALFLDPFNRPKFEEFQFPEEGDFHNLAVMYSKGFLYEIHTPKKLDWMKLPINSIQLPSVGAHYCYGSKCMMFSPDNYEETFNNG